MVVLLCRNRVADYSKWRAIFDSHTEAHGDSGLRLAQLWRGLEDPNDVFFVFEVTDLAGARAFIDAPRAAEAGRESGVLDGEYHFLESSEVQ